MVLPFVREAGRGLGPTVRPAGPGLATLNRSPVIKLVLTCHDRLPDVQSRLRRAWRFPAKWFSGRGFVAAGDARRCSGSASIVIVASGIAARVAALQPGSGNVARLTAATSGVSRDGSITGTGNAPTGGAGRKPA